MADNDNTDIDMLAVSDMDIDEDSNDREYSLVDDGEDDDHKDIDMLRPSEMVTGLEKDLSMTGDQDDFFPRIPVVPKEKESDDMSEFRPAAKKTKKSRELLCVDCRLPIMFTNVRNRSQAQAEASQEFSYQASRFQIQSISEEGHCPCQNASSSPVNY
jgi:hypothetical protein